MPKYIARERGEIPGKRIEVGETFEWKGKPPRWADPVTDSSPSPKPPFQRVVVPETKEKPVNVNEKKNA